MWQRITRMPDRLYICGSASHGYLTVALTLSASHGYVALTLTLTPTLILTLWSIRYNFLLLPEIG